MSSERAIVYRNTYVLPAFGKLMRMECVRYLESIPSLNSKDYGRVYISLKPVPNIRTDVTNSYDKPNPNDE